MSRILGLVSDAYGGRGGIAQATRDVIGALAARDETEAVDVLPRHTPEATDSLPAKVRQVGNERCRVRFAAKALGLAVTKKPDIVFCNHLYMAPLAALVSRLTGAKLIIQLHGIEIWKAPVTAQRWALESADLLLCVSRDTRARALTYCDLPPERAIVVNNTVDQRFSPRDRDAARAKFGLDDEYVILAVGRLDSHERYKGHDRVIAALPHLVGPSNRPIMFLIAGEGDDRARLESCAATTAVANRVRFLAPTPGADLPNLYCAADLFVLPSTGEGFGIVFLEAMASGTPAIGLAVGGVPDALGDGELGTLVEPNVDFALALQTAIEAPRPNPHALAAAVQARFGAEKFRQSLAAVFSLQ